MTYFLQMSISGIFRKYSYRLLALFWIAGFFCGIVLSHCSSFSSWMPVILSNHLSIIEQTLLALIPFLFFSFAVYIRQPLLLCVLLFCRATVIAFVFCTLSSWFGDTGWLLSFLCCFYSVMLLPLFFWYALHSINCGMRFSLSVFLFVAIVSAIMAAVYFIWLLPLVGRYV